MTPVSLHLRGGPRPWHRAGRTWTRGLAFDAGGRMLAGDALAHHLDVDGFLDRLAALSGTFAAFRLAPENAEAPDGENVLAGVDRIRSFPLFYGRAPDGTLHVGDDAVDLAAALDARLDDPAAVAEFLLASATTGASTLSSTICQVQAGEVVTLGPDTQRARYFRYADGDVLDASEEDLADEGVRLFERAFERLLASLAGRTVAVPLSGGMDSRLIAALLVRGGRSDAVAFTYGSERSAETRASRGVAAALGLDWRFVPYSNRDWHRWAHSEAYLDFRRYATGLTGIEHEQDWPAVLTLVGRGLDDAVFVPGHAGDFLGGSHLPAAPVADPVDAIWRRYYTEWPTDGLPVSLRSEIRARLASRLDPEAPPERAFLCFGWQERQAKMIANSVRVYEAHGADWRLPFWADADVLDFWGRVPAPLLRDRRLYFRVLRRLMGDALFDLPSTLEPPPRFRDKLRRLTDGGVGRYGMWLGPHPVLGALRTRVRDVAAIDHPVAGPVVEALARPIAGRPLSWARINGLLAVEGLREAAQRLG